MTLNFLNVMTGLVANCTLASNLALPTHSIDFEKTTGQRLSISDANFGAYDRAKFAISLWFKRESIGSTMYLYGKGIDSAANTAFRIGFTSGNKIDIITTDDGDISTPNGRLITTAAYTDTASWHHLLFHYDSANATAGNRMRLWIDEVEVTAFDTDTNPSAAVFDDTRSMFFASDDDPTTNGFDGLLYQGAFFSGSLPGISEVNNAGHPMYIQGLAGLHSLLSVAGGSVVADEILAADWTNTGAASASTTIPT